MRVYGTDVTMDTVGNFNLPANRRSAKCPRCTLPDLDAVPEPDLLSRGFTAPGDFSTAELGNFFVREFARRVLEIAAPSACRFFPTYEAKSGRPTDWFLSVPQTTVQTAKLPDKGVKCRECGEPKTMSHLEPLDFRPPAVDVFKSLQWTCRQIGEEAPWYLEGYLKTPRKELPKEQWTRLGLDRELWISTRLLMLMKQLSDRYSGTSRQRQHEGLGDTAGSLPGKQLVDGLRPVKPIACGQVQLGDQDAVEVGDGNLVLL
ncbi:MAG: hypothetical protein MUF25_12145, partial [Pirellulaceae bacterium]|nr:hypothetical protein [Pirellulaceae bacterium]